MPAEPAYHNDKLETLVRKCIVFPEDGSEARIDSMIARTVTEDDITSMRLFNRCVDMTSTFGDSYRNTQVAGPHQITRDGVRSTYLLFYNLSLNLPINLNIAYVIGVTPPQLQTKKRLFWRGDVVAMKVRLESEFSSMVKSLDADLLELRSLEKFFPDNYRRGVLESELYFDEQTCEKELEQRYQLSQ
jgi:hypothetical protein